ncbi:DoxX family protein [Jiangella endophytica]|uniref:DoxX family protein n=1 Tax=Jiangella endophytica TaxID=1623398 RepID=UPI000E350CBD|nr:DoxX family protein [Jiangella endophytica]
MPTEESQAATPPTRSTVGRRAFTVLLAWMVFSFVMGALTKFYWGETWFGDAYSVKFVEWGYPSWFRFFVGAGELVAALMLLRPPLRFAGASMLIVITFGAVVTHVANEDPLAHSISAPIHLVLALVVAWVARPRDWRGRGASEVRHGSAATVPE